MRTRKRVIVREREREREREVDRWRERERERVIVRERERERERERHEVTLVRCIVSREILPYILYIELPPDSENVFMMICGYVRYDNSLDCNVTSSI